MDYWKVRKVSTDDYYWVPGVDFEGMKGLVKATSVYTPGDQYFCTLFPESETPDPVVGKTNGVYHPDGTEVT